MWIGKNQLFQIHCYFNNKRDLLKFLLPSGKWYFALLLLLLRKCFGKGWFLVWQSWPLAWQARPRPNTFCVYIMAQTAQYRCLLYHIHFHKKCDLGYDPEWFIIRNLELELEICFDFPQYFRGCFEVFTELLFLSVFVNLFHQLLGYL